MTEKDFWGRDPAMRVDQVEFRKDHYGMVPLEFDPLGKTAKDPGSKLDAGKASVYQGAINYFPRAIQQLAMLSTKGAKKYSWKGWETVPDGINRYSDALMRHLLAEGRGEEFDPDIEMLHATAVFWNAAARLELILREKELKNG